MVAPMAAAPQAPQRLKDWQVVLYTVLLPTSIGLFIMGLLGIIALSDHQQKMWISRTPPAEYMRYLISINTGFLAIPFNGGMFGTIFLWDALRKHARARASEAPRKLSRQERRHPENAKKDG